MTGEYEIEVYNRCVHYRLTIRKSLTMIRGNSATGKTTLCNLIRSYNKVGRSSGVTLVSKARCVPLDPPNWELIVKRHSGAIFFVSKEYSFLRTKEFADCVKQSDNYFIVDSRSDVKGLDADCCKMIRKENDSEGRVFNVLASESGKIKSLNAF